MSKKPQRDKKSSSGPGGSRPSLTGRGVAFWLLLLLLLLVVFRWYSGEQRTTSGITFSTFTEQVEKGNIEELTILGDEGYGRLVDEVTIPLKDGAMRPVRDFQVGLQKKDDYYEWLRTYNPDVRFMVERPHESWLTQVLTRARPSWSTWTGPRSPSRTWRVATRPRPNSRK